MIRGSCLCGGVRYQITGALSRALNCHCSMCRKAQGAAFRSRASVRAAEFEWVQGEDLVTFYESSPGNHRGFCRVCGSPIVSKFDAHTSYYGLPLGALDDDPGVRPQLHVHVASKAPWFTITDDFPQFPDGPKRCSRPVAGNRVGSATSSPCRLDPRLRTGRCVAAKQRDGPGADLLRRAVNRQAARTRDFAADHRRHRDAQSRHFRQAFAQSARRRGSRASRPRPADRVLP